MRTNYMKRVNEKSLNPETISLFSEAEFKAFKRAKKAKAYYLSKKASKAPIAKASWGVIEKNHPKYDLYRMSLENVIEHLEFCIKNNERGWAFMVIQKMVKTGQKWNSSASKKVLGSLIAQAWDAKDTKNIA